MSTASARSFSISWPGRPPFLGEHALAVIRQAAEKPAPKLRSLVPKADRDLETICARCLEREPAARYHSAGDFAEDLERWLEGRPIIARPVSPPAQLWRWSRRNPVLAGAMGACLILLLVAGGRQFQSSRLQADVTRRVAAQHSVEFSQVFDLDNVRTDEKLTIALARKFRESLSAIGPSLVRCELERNSALNGETAAALGSSPVSVRAIYSATVRTLGDKRRVSLRLLDAGSRELLLHRTMDLDPNRDEASALAQALSRDTYTVLDAPDLSALTEANKDPGLRDKQSRDLIAAGQELADRQSQVDSDRAETCVRRAIALQPQSAKAYAELARVLTLRVAFSSDQKYLPDAGVAARRAMELDPDGGGAHQALAAVLYHSGRFSGALEEIEQSFERSGTFSRGANMAAQTCRALGRPDKAIAWATFAQKDEPHPGENAAGVGDDWALLAADDQAEQCYRHYSELHPEQPEGWMGMCRLFLLQNKPQEARQLCLANWKRYTDFAYSEQIGRGRIL